MYLICIHWEPHNVNVIIVEGHSKDSLIDVFADRAGSAGPCTGGPHIHRDRTPPLHHPECGQHRGDPARPRGGAGHAYRTHGATGILLQTQLQTQTVGGDTDCYIMLSPGPTS